MDLIFEKIDTDKIRIINDTDIKENNSSTNNHYISILESSNINIENIENSISENTNLCQKIKVEEPIKEDKELTADGILTINQQLKDIELDEKQRNEKKTIDENKQFRKDMLMRVKSLCLDKMNKPMLMNTHDLNHKEREQLIKLMNEYTGKPTQTIINDFNELCNEKLFDKKADYSNFPVYDI